MSDLNSQHNRAVWFDIPVLELDRAITFYQRVLGIAVHKHEFNGMAFAVLDHDQGNGGCLVPGTPSAQGVLLYLNAHGRLRTAVAEVALAGGEVLEPMHPIGPHGWRAIICDSEGNRVALHSGTDA